jgi:Zn-dependent peptidase ImmA (M78 family)
MDDMNVAYINPEIITWALERNGIEPEHIATGAMTADKIRAWQAGEAITEAQAEQLAAKLRIPYLVLFLTSNPPPEEVPIPDLRTRSGKSVTTPSHRFVAVINDALVRQDWFREHLQKSGRQKLGFVGRYKVTDSVVGVADNMRSVLRVNQSFRNECNSWETFLRRLITRVEEVGILVMRSGIMGHSTRQKLDAGEFQGFAISDPYAPLVFINDTDARAAQIFTLAHELAHIWIGETGISDARLAGRTMSELGQIERFCNQVAAEFLVPEKSFNVSWQPSRSVQVNLQRLRRFFWVSSLVALRRAYDLKKIGFDEFKAELDAEYARYWALDEKRKKKEAEKEKKQQGEFWATFRMRNSVLLSRTVAASVKSAATTYTQASSLLGVSISTVERFMRREKVA